MENEIKDMLNEEIVNIIHDLNDTDEDSEEYSKIVDSLVKLHKLRIEELKFEQEFDEKKKRRCLDEKDLMLKQNQAFEQKKERYFKIGMEAAGIVLPLMFYAIWMNKGFEFEKEGTFTSTTFRSLFNRFRPTK